MAFGAQPHLGAADPRRVQGVPQNVRNQNDVTPGPQRDIRKVGGRRVWQVEKWGILPAIDPSTTNADLHRLWRRESGGSDVPGPQPRQAFPQVPQEP